MIKINANKILIPVDFSEISIRAIKQGVAIAKAYQSEVILLHVQRKGDLVNVILPVFKIKEMSKMTDPPKETLENIAKQIRDEHGLKVETRFASGNISSLIPEIAERCRAGLIVMGTQGIDSSNDFFMGSNSYRVLTKSSIPVMTVRKDSDGSGYRNILLPIDSSTHSRQKVNLAIKIADRFHARLHVLGLLGKYEADYEYKLNVILPQIRKMATKNHVVCTLEIDVTTNRAEKTLEYAKQMNADLIITMTDEKTEFSDLILGTYAHQLINYSKIPVLSIPPETHPENMEEAVLGGMWQR
jgi:nucleotide-binding universal stress UspA family protein